MRQIVFECVSTTLLAGVMLGMGVILFILEPQTNNILGAGVVLTVGGLGTLWHARRLLVKISRTLMVRTERVG